MFGLNQKCFNQIHWNDPFKVMQDKPITDKYPKYLLMEESAQFTI
jgi:hypothetical protein